MTPAFKAYVVNDTDVFFGHYPVVKHELRIGSNRVGIMDPMGKDAVMCQRTDDGDPEAAGTQFVAQTRQRFDSMWTVAGSRP